MKSNFTPYCCVEAALIERNIAHCKSLNLPGPESRERPPLAVVGGGASAFERLDELKNWPGDIWAIGSAFQWCLQNGIDAAFFCIDPEAAEGTLAVGAKRAIVATCCDPSVFESLKDADVTVFDLVCTPTEGNHGVTTMTAAPQLSIIMGYREVTFFGADSSYDLRAGTHAYKSDERTNMAVVRVGNEAFVTDAEFFMQAELLANVIRQFPAIFKERSGQLLGALVKDLDYDMTFYCDLRQAA